MVVGRFELRPDPSVDLTPYKAANTRIRFRSGGLVDATDILYIDDVLIRDTMAVSITPSASGVEIGGQITYTLAITNSGVAATNVIVSSTMGAGFTPCSRNWTIPSLPTGGVFRQTSVFTATCDAVSGQHLLGIKRLADQPASTIPSNYTVYQGELALSMTPAAIEASSGEVVTWAITRHQHGQRAAL